ncbi:MAG TPA: tetratricopeptide repeat protein [Terriglobales bacterium]|nr:tetratricopeptide repeat protein [Terriglobales bacterium]
MKFRSIQLLFVVVIYISVLELPAVAQNSDSDSALDQRTPEPGYQSMTRDGAMMYHDESSKGSSAQQEAQADMKTIQKKADAAFNAKRWEEAVKYYDELVELNPGNGRAWFQLGYVQNLSKDFEKSVVSFEKSYAAGYLPHLSMYNTACGYARLGNKAKALFWLQKVADAGYSNANQFIQDEDLANVRQEPRFQQILAQVKKNSEPCVDSPESRQFDFWIGKWDVYTPTGEMGGESVIEPIMGKCVVLERWKGATGGAGTSYNAYNKELKKWQQFWVDGRGDVLLFTGERVGDEMRYRTEGTDREGNKVLRKMTFFALEKDKVRQLGESSSDGGKSWKTDYDLMYVRKKG